MRDSSLAVCENRGKQMDAISYLAEIVGFLLGSACLLRFYAPWAHVSARNPLMQFAVALTDWIVKPIRSIVPGTRSLDWAALVAAVLLALILATLAYVALAGALPSGAALIVITAASWLAQWAVWTLLAMVFLQVILSWVNPDAPMAPAVDQLTRPFLSPIRKIVPLIGNFDISPIVLIVLLQFLLRLVNSLLGKIALM